MLKMDVILQSTGVDMTIATGLIQTGVVGAPLILAVCQFINNRKAPRTDVQAIKETVLLGSLSLVSVTLMLGLYLIGALWIWQETGYSPTSDVLLSFAVIYSLLAFSIMSVQFKQMVEKRLRHTVFFLSFGVFFSIMVVLSYIKNGVLYQATTASIFWAVLFLFFGMISYPPMKYRIADYLSAFRKKVFNDENTHSKQDTNTEPKEEWWWVWDKENEDN